jgi:hypothetical protein
MKNITNNQEFDFGFNSEEFEGEVVSVPYAQFLNGSDTVFGLAISKSNAELAEFSGEGYQLIDHRFTDGTEVQMYICQTPRMVIINRSEPLMSNESETIPYDKIKYQEGDWKAFSYIVFWPVNAKNQPLSQMPFRIRCSGFAGITFLKNYSYYSNPDSFVRKFLAIYKALTGDRQIEKNEVFYAHAVYQIGLIREMAKSTHNNKSSMAVKTDSFLEPTKENFASLIIRNGSEFSDQIKSAIEETKAWLKTGTSAAVDSEPVTSDLSSLKQEIATEDEDDDNQEYVELILKDAVVCGWTTPNLEAYLKLKYNCTLDQLGQLPGIRLVEIYGAIQDPAIISMFQSSKIPL